jgi:hypothetical protein
MQVESVTHALAHYQGTNFFAMRRCYRKRIRCRLFGQASLFGDPLVVANNVAESAHGPCQASRALRCSAVSVVSQPTSANTNTIKTALRSAS